MSKRYLGDLGENTLRTWASQVGIAATKADPDRTGWDFILEFPRVYGSLAMITLPLDQEPRPIQCLVQVKSTDGRSGTWDVKLSNWVRLVKTPLPAFFLVLEFDSKDDCQRAYLVHIDEVCIRHVLKRLRELDPSDRNRLHKLTLRFKWSGEHELPSLSGKDLEESIRRHVEDMEAYVDHKTAVLRTAGYEDGKWQLDVIIPMPPDISDPREILVDWSLGLIPHLDVMQGSVWDFRFGVRAPEPTETFEDGRVIIARREPVGHGTVQMISPDTRRELRISTEVYMPQGIGFALEPEQFKARFAAPFLNFIFWPFQQGRADIEYELPKPRQEYYLTQLQPVSELVLILRDAGTGSGRIEFEARFDSRPLYIGQIRVRGAVSRQVVDYAAAMAHGWTVAKHFDVHQAVELKPSELLQQEHRLMFMASVVGPTCASVGIQYQSYESRPNDDKSMCLPFVTNAVLGKHRATIAVAIIGQPEETGQRRQKDGEVREYTMETCDVRLCYQHICDRAEKPRYTFKDLAQSVVDQYEESCDILIAEGINDYLKDTAGQE